MGRGGVLPNHLERAPHCTRRPTLSVRAYSIRLPVAVAHPLIVGPPPTGHNFYRCGRSSKAVGVFPYLNGLSDRLCLDQHSTRSDERNRDRLKSATAGVTPHAMARTSNGGEEHRVRCCLDHRAPTTKGEHGKEWISQRFACLTVALRDLYRPAPLKPSWAEIPVICLGPGCLGQ